MLEEIAAKGLAGRVVEHLMLDCRGNPRRASALLEQLGLNEVSVQTGPSFAMIDLDLYIDSELVTTYSCDGLILSTPVGSTAHSLSAGGPILRKELQAFVISPISPHTLTNRPVVDSADRVYELVVAKAGSGTAVVVDGRVACTRDAEGPRPGRGRRSSGSRWSRSAATATTARCGRNSAGAAGSSLATERLGDGGD